MDSEPKSDFRSDYWHERDEESRKRPVPYAEHIAEVRRWRQLYEAAVAKNKEQVASFTDILHDMKVEKGPPEWKAVKVLLEPVDVVTAVQRYGKAQTMAVARIIADNALKLAVEVVDKVVIAQEGEQGPMYIAFRVAKP